MDELYDTNKAVFDALNIYIEAAHRLIAELNEKTIPEAAQAAEAEYDTMANSTVHDRLTFASRLEKRAYDLQLARTINILTAPQIRLILNTHTALAEKILASVHTDIPSWKKLVAIALTLLRTKNAVTATRLVSENTNDLRLKNSEMLKN